MGGGAGKQKQKNNQPAQAPVVPQQSRRPSFNNTRVPSTLEREQLGYTQVQGAVGQSTRSLRSIATDDPIVDRPDNTPSPPPGFAPPTLQPRLPSTPSTRSSTPSMKQPSVGAGSPIQAHHHHGHSALSNREQPDRFCSHCPHCKRRSNDDYSLSSTPTLPWLRLKPGNKNVCINMDQYDTDGVKEHADKQKSSSLLTATSIVTKTDYDATKENYFRLPFVAKTSPRVTSTCTPFPGYSSLQRKERRANKPYTSTLFVD